MSNNLINSHLEQLAEIFKALSNPHRLRIFTRLLSCCAPGTVCSVKDEGCACIGDLSQDLDIASSTVSHHIKELRRAGLIRMRRNGQKIECWVEPRTVSELAGFFTEPDRRAAPLFNLPSPTGGEPIDQENCDGCQRR